MSRPHNHPTDLLAYTVYQTVQAFGYWLTYEWLKRNGHPLQDCLWLLFIANRYIAFTLRWKP
jgi:hypothetical protein